MLKSSRKLNPEKKSLYMIGVVIVVLGAIILWQLMKFDFESISGEGLDDKINALFQPATDLIEKIIFYSITLKEGVSIPIVMLILVIGAVYFTIYFKFINFRKFFLSFKVTRGLFDSIDSKAREVHTDDYLIGTSEGDILKTEKIEKHIGEVSHFQALTAALSATVGLGNIAGVAIAIGLGGPGATLWMILAGLFGMTTKFVECTLGVKYRDIEPDGTVHGGPMYYLKKGLAEKKMAGFGKVLAIIFAIMTIGGSFGGGNMFQANQASEQLAGIFNWETGYTGFVFGLIFAIFVGLVIIGGIKRIGSVTSRIVPIMAVVYVGAAILILLIEYDKIGWAMQLIFKEAVNPAAVTGGLVGVMVQGIRRAVFSNEAGVGSAAIAHSAVKTRFPVSEGLVAMIGPFVDTVIICTMTALVIIITGHYDQTPGTTTEGVNLTSQAFNSAIPYFEYVLTFAVVLFAFSTMISWSYYGLQSWKFIFGKTRVADLSYKLLFLIFVIIGSSASLGAVVGFSDAMIFAMVFPNMIGLIILTPEVKKEYNRYILAIKAFYANKKKSVQ
jgi:AGCS family alanine or glycine:cation symporter